MYAKLLAVSFACYLFLAAGSAARALDIDVTAFRLGNGMDVVVIPDRRAPVVTHMVWYRVGSADEPEGKSGIAHFLEHLMFKGTPTVGPGEFDRIVSRMGGDSNAFTSRDYTAYFVRIAREGLERVMQLEADRMQNLVLTDEIVVPERDVVREERRQRTENNPTALLGEQLDAVTYLVHPYRKPVIGWMPEVAELTRQDALAFYRANYTPANAVLVVAGDVAAGDVKTLAEKHFGPLKNTFEPKARLRAGEPEQIAERRVILRDARASSPMFQRSYLAPSYSTAAESEAEALDTLAEIIGGGTQSRLYRQLVVDRKIASYAGAWYSGDGLDSGTLGVHASPNPGRDIAEIERAVEDVLRDVAANGVTADEFERARNKLVADAVYTLDSQSALARVFGIALTTGSGVDDVLQWESRMERLTVESVSKAARDVLDDRRSVTGILIPDDGAGGAPELPPQPDSAVQ